MSSKKAYLEHSIIETIACAIELLCDNHHKCTPTEIIEFCGYKRSKELRTLILEVAEIYEYSVISSGKGYVIWSWEYNRGNDE